VRVADLARRRRCCGMQYMPCAVQALRSRRRTRSLPCALFGYFRNRCSGPFFPNRRTGWARGRWARRSPRWGFRRWPPLGVPSLAPAGGSLADPRWGFPRWPLGRRSVAARSPLGHHGVVAKHSGRLRSAPARLASSRARVLGQREEERRQVIRRSFRRGSALRDCARNRLWGPPETRGKTRRKSLSG
jgi:hypothetical protein